VEADLSNPQSPIPNLQPLGDQAILAYLPDEAAAVRFAAAVREANPPWLFDVVPAYASVGVFFDADRIGTAAAMEWLLASGGRKPPDERDQRSEVRDQKDQVPDSSLTSDLCPLTSESGGSRPPLAKTFTIPVCYEFAPDLSRVCEHTHLSPDEVIRLHTATEFTVYAVGFVPGFPYMGYLPPELCGVGRLSSPRVRVEPGSVAITGRQTAIYPQASPGGWNLIGRTPIVIVDVKDGFFPLRVGDRVRFARIDETRYRELEGERLSPGERPG
jgi:inhibitor of KinA